MKTEIRSDRFLLRELEEQDVTAAYLSWLRDPEAVRYIAATSDIQDLTDLKRYVRDRLARSDVLFLGIFDASNGKHIGNIKFEPLNEGLGYAVMGMLIGDPSYRGKGVAPEILAACARWLKKNRNIRQIVLGVSGDNDGAIRAYRKSGFVPAESIHLPTLSRGSISMVLDLNLPQFN